MDCIGLDKRQYEAKNTRDLRVAKQCSQSFLQEIVATKTGHCKPEWLHWIQSLKKKIHEREGLKTWWYECVLMGFDELRRVQVALRIYLDR